ncbi:MAG: DUF2807 domain-containing protein [Bacteroidales bacterium]|nr:DUF2807 domain-containing protein [Bacteroidales bacterium]
MKKLIILFVAITSLLFASCSCVFSGIHPEGEYIAKTINAEPFENISYSAGMELIITQDSTTSVVLETYENIHDYIQVEVVDNTLKITKDFSVNFINPKIKIYVKTAKLEKITASAGTRLDMSAGWEGETLDIDISAGSSAIGNLMLKELSLNMSAGTRAEFEGRAEKFSLDATSGSSFKSYNMETSICDVNISSGALAYLNVSDYLSAEASSGASIRYKGNPQLKTKIHSGASIRNVD